MMQSRAVDIPPPRVRSHEARAWGLSLLVAAMWFDVLYAATRHAGALATPAWLAAVVGVATQLAFTACEALVAVQAWRVAGESVRWRELAPQLLAVSSLEALATAIAAGQGPLPRVVAVGLAGARAAGDGPPHSGPAFAFAGFGALAVARLLLSAQAQAGVARASFARALLLVLTLYLATRLVMWWSFDLMQGRSFQRWG
jgi:hypothetical protein